MTVRFIPPDQFSLQTGVIKPVAARVAEQLHACQVLRYSRAFSKGDEDEIRRHEEERVRYQQYVRLLDVEQREKLIRDFDVDLTSVRSASPIAKGVVYNAFRTSRYMRNPKDRW